MGTRLQRQADDRWELTVAGPGDLLCMDDLGVTLTVDAIYAGVEDLGEPSRDTVAHIRTPGLRVVRVEDLSSRSGAPALRGPWPARRRRSSPGTRAAPAA